MTPRERVAFIMTGSWGDLYVATAALQEIALAWPGARISVVGSDKWTQIIDPATWPMIDRIVSVQPKWASGGGTSAWSGELFTPSSGKWVSAHNRVRLLSEFRNVKASYNLRTESLRFAWAPWLSGVPIRHGSASGPLAKILYTHLAPWLGKDPLIHERDRMLQVVEAPNKIGRLSERQATGLPALKKPDLRNAEKLARSSAKKYWLINPTSSRIEKAWPAERFRELFLRLQPRLEKDGLDLRLLGAPWETNWLRAALPQGFNEADYIVQPPDVSNLLDVLGGAALLITNTSSAQFMTPGLGTQTLTLMGRARPEIWGPLGANDVVVRGRSDPKLDGQMFAQEADAYQSISVARVFDECERILSRSQAKAELAP